ncbi:hypothetical protein IFR04_008333 [Cadophora malorum]|uniref:Uncharacterized protein n=1 Tax=Cadophora malorum TaxID=108018 RepID=A0A8H7TBG6_9HELO|nr:hypothetical protein IFR04_008333 [Cadophora malorum]
MTSRTRPTCDGVLQNRLSSKFDSELTAFLKGQIWYKVQIVSTQQTISGQYQFDIAKNYSDNIFGMAVSRELDSMRQPWGQQHMAQEWSNRAKISFRNWWRLNIVAPLSATGSKSYFYMIATYSLPIPTIPSDPRLRSEPFDMVSIFAGFMGSAGW